MWLFNLAISLSISRGSSHLRRFSAHAFLCSSYRCLLLNAVQQQCRTASFSYRTNYQIIATQFIIVSFTYINSRASIIAISKHIHSHSVFSAQSFNVPDLLPDLLQWRPLQRRHPPLRDQGEQAVHLAPTISFRFSLIAFPSP